MTKRLRDRSSGGAVGTTGPSQDQRVETAATLFRMLGRPVANLEQMGGGRNSKVYRITCGNSDQFVAKFYYHHPADNRNRLETEFSGLQFLWNNGVRCVPRPIVADRDIACAVYEYIEGEHISAQDVTERDVGFAVDFLIGLKELKESEGIGALPMASEAYLSVHGIVENLEARVARLESVQSDGVCYQALRRFLVDGFQPAFEEITGWCKLVLQESGQSFQEELPIHRRTLSPSDFGFHNALRRPDGGVTFLDFEYFGWDDPAKMICDFLLHPAAGLPEGLKGGFVANIVGRFEESQHLATRIKAVYPLFGLKWCLILLNEFIPANLLRRDFIEQSDVEDSEIQAEQLAKAEEMLQHTTLDYRDFPYHD